MTARAELPPALAPWAPALSALTPELAVTLGPMVRRLDDMISTYDPDSGGSGPLDGYEGLVWRGPPERLLGSGWVLGGGVARGGGVGARRRHPRRGGRALAHG